MNGGERPSGAGLCTESELGDAFPSAASVLEQFAAIAAPRKRKLLFSLLQVLGIVRAAETGRQGMIRQAANGINPFDLHVVPDGFGGILPEFSFSILFDRTTDLPLQRAAKLLLAALEYRERLRSASSGGVGWERQRHIFGRVVNLRRAGMKWRRTVKDCTDSAHIAVAARGHYYLLEVLDAAGSILPAAQLLSGLAAIRKAAAGETAAPSHYGLLTANMARASAAVFHAVPPDPSIAAIDDAILLMAMDDDVFPRDANEAARLLHFGDLRNRDYRKALQLVVLGNGWSGGNFNLFAGIEGAPGVEFAAWIPGRALAMADIDATPAQAAICRRLAFDTVAFASLPLPHLQRGIDRYRCDLPLIKTIDSFGKEDIKRLNVSPDAFFHAAAHLAYFDAFKRPPTVHGFSDIRRHRFQSITRHLSTTPEMLAFLHTRTKPALIAALEAHGRQAAAVKAGNFPVHFVFFYLFTKPGPRSLLAMLLFRMFIPRALATYASPDIWASNIPAVPGIHAVGRFGTYFKMVRRNCLAGHYLLFPDCIRICFLSRDDRILRGGWQFERALAQAIATLRRILS